ncbi:MAG: saccharopine dehydrogenase NADP-binding domain-containing protein [Synechococcales cyanobacterium]
MGRLSVRDLLETGSPTDRIVIADTDVERIAAQIASYPHHLDCSRLETAVVNVQDVQGTAALLQDATVVINATPYRFNLLVMAAAHQAQVHYVDLGGLFHMTRQQWEWHERFQAIGKTAILGIGAAPGISNVLAVHGAEWLQSVREIHIRVAGIDQTHYDPRPLFPVGYSLATILEELSAPPALFSAGEFVFVEPLSGHTPLHFPRPVGKQHPLYTLHSEVATLPISFAERGIQEVSFKIALDPVLIERVVFLQQLGLTSDQPLPLAEGTIRPVDVLHQLLAQQPPIEVKGSLDQYEIIRVVLKGSQPLPGKGWEKATVIVDCHVPGVPEWNMGSDVDTGSPPVIAAQLLAEGTITQAGVFPPEQIIPVQSFLGALRRRHMIVKVTEKKGWDFLV